MRYLEQLLDMLIKWEGDRLEVNLQDPPFVWKEGNKNFITKVPFTENEFHLIEKEFAEEFGNAARFMSKDQLFSVAWTEKSCTIQSEEDQAAPFELVKLLQLAVQQKASELFLVAGSKPFLRIDGDLSMVMEYEAPKSDVLADELLKIIPESYRGEFEVKEEFRFVQELGDRSRFRVHIFWERRGLSAIFRRIPVSPIYATDLGFPPAFLSLCSRKKGLILISGPSGSGRSTTLASLIDYINRTQNRYIVMLEEPVEYIHWNRRSLVQQKRLPFTFDSLEKNLSGVMKSNADVVAIGEVKDNRSMAMALEMAASGVLVLISTPMFSVMSTIDRIIDQFHPTHKVYIRSILANSFLGCISQVLCRKRDGGRVAAFEILMSNDAVANIIREGKTFQLATVMQTGNQFDNRLLNDSLLRLVELNWIHPQEAMIRTWDSEGLKNKMKLKGVVV